MGRAAVVVHREGTKVQPFPATMASGMQVRKRHLLSTQVFRIKAGKAPSGFLESLKEQYGTKHTKT